MIANFCRTHRHKEGGEYQVLGTVMMHMGENNWKVGVEYMNEDGKKFVRSLESFKERFIQIL